MLSPPRAVSRFWRNVGLTLNGSASLPAARTVLSGGSDVPLTAPDPRSASPGRPLPPPRPAKTAPPRRWGGRSHRRAGGGPTP